MRNRISLNAIAITGREKKSVGIDFDMPVKKREKKVKEEEPELFEQVFTSEHYAEYKKSGNKNMFEEIIDKMMVESCMDETFKPYMDEIREIIGKKLPTHKKRFAILCTLDKNRNLLRKAKVFNNIPVSKMEHIKDYVKILRQYVKVSEVEKKKFGEVMTPIELVTEMLNKLPREVWSNPNLKWLEPCNGVGPFGVLVVAGLMKGLAEWEPDEDKRFKHIIQNMVYVCELQPKNMFLWMCMMDPRDEHYMNIYCGSFLDGGFDKHMREVWGIEKFDVVVGNPPYNLGQDAKGKRGGGDTLWDKFVIKSVSNLKQNGLLCYVHPTLWRKPQSEKSSSNEVNKLMMQKQIHYLEMHNSADGMRVFNAGTRYDFYVLENSPLYKETKINDENRIDSLVNLSGYEFIPNKNLEFFLKIKANFGEERCPIIFNRTNYGTDKDWVIDTQDATNTYTLIHSTPQKGTRYMYSSRNDKGHFGISKVIFGDSGIYDAIIDMEGNYGMTQHSMAIQVSSLEEAENIKKTLLSDNFTKFLESVMWSNFQLDWRLFTYLKKDFWKEFI